MTRHNDIGNAYDGLGSTTAVVEADGDYVQYRYDPFGEQLSGPTAGQPFRFTGEQQDTDVVRDPYYLRARYYDPEIGRFWSKDPWRGSTVLPQTLNGYGYTANNPVNAADPRGLCHLTGCEEPRQPVPFWPPVDIEAPDIGIEFGPTAENWKWLGRGVSDVAEGAWDSIFGGGQDEEHRYDPNANPGHISIREGLSQMGTWASLRLRCGVFREFRQARLVRRICRGIAGTIGAGIIGCATLEVAAPILWGEKPPRCRP
jgi:RHS repeat-associated protein